MWRRVCVKGWGCEEQGGGVSSNWLLGSNISNSFDKVFISFKNSVKDVDGVQHGHASPAQRRPVVFLS